jgi:hypothetical protein
MAYSIDDLRRLYLTGNKSAIEGEKAAINLKYNTEIQNYDDAYKSDVAQTEQAYSELLDQNAIQRKINERQIVESMANAGLTNSGMNASQILASQLSYGNAQAQANLQKQNALDTLARTLRVNKQTVESKRASDLAGVDSTYSANADKYAMDVYNEQQNAAEAQSKARTDLISILADENVSSTVKNAYYSDYIKKYGYDPADTSLIDIANQQGINAQATENKDGTFTVDIKPYTQDEFNDLLNMIIQHGGSAYNKEGNDKEANDALYDAELVKIIAQKAAEWGMTPPQAVELQNALYKKAGGKRGTVDPMLLEYRLDNEGDKSKDYSGDIADSIIVVDQYGIKRTIGNVYYNYREYLARQKFPNVFKAKYATDEEREKAWSKAINNSEIRKAARKKIIELQENLEIE